MAATNIAQEITRLTTAKADLKTAIEGKGVTVPSSTLLDGYAALVDQIQKGGAEEAPENDVNFYDYDGFRVASYTIAEAKALTQAQYNAILPPAHSGLTFQEWNWSLSDISSYNRRYIDVGAHYVTTDGKTHLKCTLQTPTLDTYIYLWWGKGTLTVDWGDNTTEYSVAHNTFSGEKITHTYAQMGDYDIKISFVQSDDTGSWGPIYRNRTESYWSYNLKINEINCGNYLNLGFTNGGFDCINNFLISVAKSVVFTSTISTSFNYCQFTQMTIPKNMGVATFLYSTGLVCYPKEVASLSGTNWHTHYRNINGKCILPEYSSGTPTNSLGQNFRIVSLPNSLNITPTLYADTEIIDIVQGFVPAGNWTLSGSSLLLVDGLVDFFTKLGTTQTAITLTLGANNLNKLTADQKAIATNKGYTLA